MKTMRKNSVTLALLSLGVFVLPVLLSLAVPVAQAKPADTRLQEGLYAEEIEGDLGAAIKIYEQIINDKSAEDTYVARAMYRLGLCHVKKNDEKLVSKAREIVNEFFLHSVNAFYDETDSIGRRYARQDEAGTPWCLTVDYQSLDDDTITIRYRDTMEQERISIADAVKTVEEKLRTKA